ncbi:MAG: DUF3667 domain-containing protein [Saprospiraceae bacterium]
MSRFSAYDPTSCLNCGAAFAASTKFCPSCGQKNRKHELSLVEWLTEGLSTFFHLEGKTLNTVRDLVVPGKMATNYFNGQRQRYVHPFRLLVFSSLICFGLISIANYFNPEEGVSNQIMSIGVNETKVNHVTPGDSMATIVMENFDDHPISGRMKAIDLLRARIVDHDRFELIADSMSRAGAGQDSALVALLDTMRNFYTMPNSWMGEGTYVSNGDTIDFDSRGVASLSPAEVVEASDVKGWVQRYLFQKGIKAYQNGAESLTKLFYGNLSWAVLIYVPFLALGYKLFYRGKMPLYTQHLTYSAILMSVALLLYGVGAILDTMIPFGIASAVLTILYLVYNYISDKRLFLVSYLHAFAKLNVLAAYGFAAFMLSMMIWFFTMMVFI